MTRVTTSGAARTICSILLTGSLLAGLGGCGSDDKAKKALADARVQAQKIVADATQQARRKIADAQTQIDSDKKAAQSDLDDVRSQISDARGRLNDVKHNVSSERAKLGRLQAQVSGVRSQIARNTIPGTGTFVVGSDISPGTYRAAARSGCYWARLASLDTSDIVDNDNADGPVVVEILPSDKAFNTSDCADFHKVG